MADTSTHPTALITTVSVGAGHFSVSRALGKQLHMVAPEIEVMSQDVLNFAPWWFRVNYVGSFELGMSRFPRIYGLSYWMLNRPHRPTRGGVEKIRLWGERLAMPKFAEYLLRTAPDLVVNTHFLAAPLVGRLIRQSALRTRQVMVLTDIEMHRFWYSENIEHWFVPTNYTADTLKRWGIPTERISVTGVPIHPKWARPLDKETILREWNLPSDRPIVILTGGTQFVCAPVGKIARAILTAHPGVHLIVLGGRNKKLLRKLGGWAKSEQRVTVLGFTDRMHELVQVSSLMLTKGGGVTAAECLSKRVPMVLMKPVPGHERGNAEYLERQGAAVIARSVGQIVQEVCRILDDKEALEQMRRCAAALHRPATETVVDAIRNMLH